MYEYALIQSEDSDLVPLLNAIEVYSPINFSGSVQPTHQQDFYALMSIKHQYKVKKNWMGDPCLPPTIGAWDGLTCNYNSSTGTVIQKVNLSSSDLTGEIDATFGNLISIDSLDLSFNNLTGPIPEFLANMPSLRVLNLAGNQLSGSVPLVLLQRSKDNLLVLSIEGNKDLYGSEANYKRKSTKSKSAIVLSAVVPIKITNNFVEKIGRGGFGTVYRGVEYDGTQVAVKLLDSSSSQGTKEFLAEVQHLSRVHHRNLVVLLGYCKDGVCCMALVYEYMSGGSLCRYLRGDENNSRVLSWEERLRIVLEAAQGLLYLHRECNPPIIHRDVKTENILLNHMLEAKIADFGLSKAFRNNCTHVSTVVAGTPGYLDLEYHSSYQLTEKSDVYSFGVVLLEIVTGQPPIIDGNDKIHLTYWVRQKLTKGSMDDVADTRLLGRYDVNSAWKVVDLAMNCCAVTSAQRPVMSRVVSELKECLELVHGASKIMDSVRSSSSRRIAFEVEKNGESVLRDGPSAR
ncbi:hypothetical protein LUZ61_021149 [Rhynchospora tenuis]|uniref:Protein kinase domain-containing protein n=1 Tax=Rhynchospora tenuis TaxID=198213 RepID=A0AAD5W8N4_9POAL|nr:hypothetical protein LUZ61_021149 [Rhynchospora tenuis]